MHLFFKHSAYVWTSGEFKSAFLLFKRTKYAYLLSFTELLVLEAPGDGGCGVTRSLTGQGDLFLKLGGSLVIQVGDLGLHYEKDPQALVTHKSPCVTSATANFPHTAFTHLVATHEPEHTNNCLNYSSSPGATLVLISCFWGLIFLNSLCLLFRAGVQWTYQR